MKRGGGRVRLIHVRSQRTSVIIAHFYCGFYEPGPILSVTDYSSFNSHKFSQPPRMGFISRNRTDYPQVSGRKKMETKRGYIARPRSHISSTVSGIQTQSLCQAAQTEAKNNTEQQTKKQWQKNSHGAGLKSLDY